MHIERQAEQYGDMNEPLPPPSIHDASRFAELMSGSRIQTGHNLLVTAGEDDCPCCGEDEDDCTCGDGCENCTCSGKG